MTEAMTSNRRIVLVTGPAGAGRSSTLNVLEDAGFEAIDNSPMRMLRALIEAPGQLRPMALGVDLRNRDFSTDRVIELMADMRSRPDIDIELLYLDCYAGFRKRAGATRWLRPRHLLRVSCVRKNCLNRF